MAYSSLPLFRSTLAALALAIPLVAPVAQAQTSRSAEQQAYDRGYEAGRADVARPAEYAAPPGYDGSQPPPPPPGYRAGGISPGADPQDPRYQAYAEDWAQRYCVPSGQSAGTGAVIGGLLGALVGSRAAGRHDRGDGALIGGAAGAAGGAIAGSVQYTSPGCPPGFVARGGAPIFAYDGPGYLYAAPDWYQPWYFFGGRWLYRPYPYHGWYYRNYRTFRPGYGGRGYGRPSYRYSGGYGHRGYHR